MVKEKEKPMVVQKHLEEVESEEDPGAIPHRRSIKDPERRLGTGAQW